MLLLLLFCWQPQPFEVVKSFEPPIEGDEYLTLPHGIGLSADGRLYVADARRNRILAWRADGTFDKGFGRSGEGPGEMLWPMNLAVTDTAVWVADGRRKLHRFSLDGEFEETVRTELYIRTMSPAGEGQILAGMRSLDPESDDYTMNLYRVNLADGSHQMLKSWVNHTVMNLEGNNDVLWKAFGADIHVNSNEKGQVYVGFSEDPFIWTLGPDKALQKAFRIDVPPRGYSDEDKALVKEMSFPNGQGGRFSMGDLPNWRWDFDGDKSPFTMFTIKGNKALLILTPLGSIQGVGLGFHHGDYYVFDYGKGKVLDGGMFRYPEDSKIFVERGRIIGMIIDEDGEYAVHELGLQAF